MVSLARVVPCARLRPARASRLRLPRRGVATASARPDRDGGSSSSFASSPPRRPRRTLGAVLASYARLAPAVAILAQHHPDSAHAAGWYNDAPGSGDAFVGGGGEGFGAKGDEAEYDYGTKDLAVDLASPLVAYKLVSWALNQEVPVWLDAIILAFVLAAAYVCIFDVDALDDVLV
jgi:hypothetical protein